MFLRATKRFKDGKVHYYWSMVENVRVGRRVFRIARVEAEPPKAVARGVRQALYLGELNDSQREEWQRAIEAFDEKGNVRQLKLFPEDRAPETYDGRIVTLPRYVEPKPDLAVLLNRLGLTLPAQPPPKISSEAADAAKSTV